MPFSEERKEVYTYGIKPVCESAGFQPLRVDELKGHFNINRKIIEHLFISDAIIAELTDKNPNVFYEMGVAHALGNKTVMIVQDTKKLPFDIRNYRCIQYKQSVAGLKKLEQDIIDSLLAIDEWRKYATNPVQDFKPYDAFILKSEFKQLQKELRQKEVLLKKTVTKSEWTALKKELLEKEKMLSNSASKIEMTALQKEQMQAEKESLQKQVEQLRSQLAAAKTSPKPPSKTAKIGLRSNPLQKLSRQQVKEMLKEKGFFDSNDNKTGKGLKHQYEKSNGMVKLVTDKTTGLTWRQSGSESSMNYEKTKTYVEKLNSVKHTGFDDWRLPTLEEAMSLMETGKKRDLYIDPIFDANQKYIWTADKLDASFVWIVDFFKGCSGIAHVSFHSPYVRAVR